MNSAKETFPVAFPIEARLNAFMGKSQSGGFACFDCGDGSASNVEGTFRCEAEALDAN